VQAIRLGYKIKAAESEAVVMAARLSGIKEVASKVNDIWSSLVVDSAAGRFPCGMNNGLWLSAILLLGNATLIVSEPVCMQPPSPRTQKARAR
jgi:hypothetical protein